MAFAQLWLQEQPHVRTAASDTAFGLHDRLILAGLVLLLALAGIALVAYGT